ncbi:hypothetical protein CEXT_256891 [Caerostris extrusa]|uniref:Uncharacterized protein n=1 Tax=Caerostris extrusa TaxID=172846 RepID=A0AAV4X8D8_CAEEX|nr:hypothetical protein CEXT_256891 [Caerostris extrusa]
MLDIYLGVLMDLSTGLWSKVKIASKDVSHRLHSLPLSPDFNIKLCLWNKLGKLKPSDVEKGGGIEVYKLLMEAFRIIFAVFHTCGGNLDGPMKHTIVHNN